MSKEDTTLICVVESRGTALVELAAWLVVLCPMTLFALALCATAHDRNVAQNIPDTLMRESSGRLITWRSGGSGGELAVDSARVRMLVRQLADRALAELSSVTLKLKSPAVRACYWIYNIDTQVGSTAGLRAQGCEERNAPDNFLQESLDRARNSRISVGRLSEPISLGSTRPHGYVSLAVLVGVSVGGKFGGWEGLCDPEPVQHAAVWIPRGDTVL